MRRNSKSVFYEPLVAACAYAFAGVLDRIRYDTLPACAEPGGAAAARRLHRRESFGEDASLGGVSGGASRLPTIARIRCAWCFTPGARLVGKVAILALKPNPWFLAAGVLLDLLIGDP